MIKVNISEDSGYRVTVKGHAGYKNGDDIVCAGVSAIIYALLGYLENGEDAFDYITEDGYTDIFCDEKSREAVRMCAVGLMQIGNAYPANVVVECSFM